MWLTVATLPVLRGARLLNRHWHDSYVISTSRKTKQQILDNLAAVDYSVLKSSSRCGVVPPTDEEH